MRDIKVAVVQAGSVLFDADRTLDKLQALTAEAARAGAQLVVFPEAFVGGYPKGADFGVRLGSRTAEGRDDFRRYFDSAITIPGPSFERMQSIAREHGVHLVVGVIERGGSTLYCTAVMLGADGALLGAHRKVMPTAMERVLWGTGDGSTLTVAPTPLGRLGSVICWENYMPLLRTAMYAQGIELYCAPTVDDRDTWLPTMRTIALEGRCFVLSACQYFQSGEGASIRGGSCIIDPLGSVLLAPRFDVEMIGYATLDLGMLARGKFDLDVVGHYARPDIFKLTVNTQRLTAVELTRE